jgi:hypothetical protein
MLIITSSPIKKHISEFGFVTKFYWRSLELFVTLAKQNIFADLSQLLIHNSF